MKRVLAVLTFLPLVVPAVFAFVFIATAFLGGRGIIYDITRLGFIGSIGVCLLLMPYYIWRAARNPTLDHRPLWIVMLLAAPQLAMPAYFLKFERVTSKVHGP